MSVGMVLLTAAAILVFFGVAQRVLDKMYLSDRAALLLIALMFFGTLIPNLKLGAVEVSIGGALIPAGVCVYLLIRAGTWKERIRAVVGALLTGGIVFAVSAYLLPDEPETMVIDPMYLNGIIAGLMAYVLGRSRRGAFICGVLGVRRYHCSHRQQREGRLPDAGAGRRGRIRRGGHQRPDRRDSGGADRRDCRANCPGQ